MDNSGTRLNKFLASCGIGSRRACDRMIQEGFVVVNGQVEKNPATRVTDEDFVKIDGKRVKTLQTETILINKPRDLVCTKNDELDRDTVYALIPPKYQHLNHVGRLDKDSEGLLILTNDGDLAQAMTHPSKKIEKEYIVTVDQAFENEVLTKFLKGVHTLEGKAQAKAVRRLSPRRVVIVLETGMKRQIRLMFQSVHIKVTKLVRVRIGTLVGQGIEPGKYRVLEREDIDALFAKPPVDPKMTSLESRERSKLRKSGKSGPKKWTRPVSRSHDGTSASDRPKRKNTSSQRSEQSDSERSFSRKPSGSNRGGPSRNGSSAGKPKKFGNKPSGGRPSGGRNTGRPSGPSRGGRPSSSGRPASKRGSNNSSRRRD